MSVLLGLRESGGWIGGVQTVLRVADERRGKLGVGDGEETGESLEGLLGLGGRESGENGRVGG